MITKENAHLYIPHLQALSEGKDIQFLASSNNNHWVNVGNAINFSLPPEYYRVNPDKKWCRIGLLRSADQTPYTIKISDVRDETMISTHVRFVRWLTDRIEYE
jgi:hypothetical protein